MSENVFAYGSNMCLGRLRDCGVIPGEQGRALVLRGYRLLFNKTSTDGSGKANVEAQTDEDVWGVLYTLGEADLRVLDRREAGYYREKTVVQTAEGSSIEAWVYLAQQPSRDPGLCPYTWYKRFLVEGAKAHFLPAQYIRALESIEATQDEDEQRDREKRAIACVS